MSKILNPKFYILIIIIIIAVFFRLYSITEVPPGLYPDEAMNGNNALEALSTGSWKVFYPENNGREGLFINIQAVFLKFLMPLFGGNPEPWMLRLPSALFGILTVLGVYFLTKEFFSENTKFKISNLKQIQNSNIQNSKSFRISNFGFRISRGDTIALLSSFFIATSFWHISLSRIGFRAIMASFFLVWTICFLCLALRNITPTEQSISEKYKIQNPKSQTNSKFQFQNLRHIFFSIIGGIFYGLGFYSYIAYRATPLLILIILLLYWFKTKHETDAKPNVKQMRKNFLFSTFCFLLSTFIVTAPLGSYFIENPQDFFSRTIQASIFVSSTPLEDLGVNILKTAGMFNFFGDWNWRHNIAGRPLLFWPVGILFVIGSILGIRQLLKFQITSTKLQTNLNDQISNTQNISDLEFRISNLFEIYNLRFVILFFWLIIAALPVVISEGIPHTLRAILMAPPVFIFAGIGGAWLIEKIIYNKKHKLSLIISYLLLVLLIIEAYISYFILWGKNPHTVGAFNTDYVRIGRELRELPKELPKYVVVKAAGVDVRGIPMPAQTVMFITDTFTLEKQKEKNLYYILPDELEKIDQEKNYIVYLK